MEETLGTARSATAWGMQAGRNALEETRNGLYDVIVPIYILGLVLPIPIGWIGDFIGWLILLVPTVVRRANIAQGSWYGDALGWVLAHMENLAGFFYHLGHIPAALAFVLVGYYYWQIVGRGVIAEGAVHALPNWLQNIVAKWSVLAGVLGRYFRIMASSGMWGSVLLWVPLEFPVWRHVYHYSGALALTMALTYVVATSKHFDTFWRKFYGGNLVWIAARHALGLMGYELVSLWAYVSSTSFDFSDLDSFEIMLLFVGLALVVAIVLPALSKSTSTSTSPSH